MARRTTHRIASNLGVYMEIMFPGPWAISIIHRTARPLTPKPTAPRSNAALEQQAIRISTKTNIPARHITSLT